MSSAHPAASSGGTNDQLSANPPPPALIRTRSPSRRICTNRRVRGLISRPSFSFLWMMTLRFVTMIDALRSS